MNLIFYSTAIFGIVTIYTLLVKLAARILSRKQVTWGQSAIYGVLVTATGFLVSKVFPASPSLISAGTSFLVAFFSCVGVGGWLFKDRAKEATGQPIAWSGALKMAGLIQILFPAIVLMVVVAISLTQRRSGPKDMNAFVEYFSKLDQERQKSVQSEGPLATLRISEPFHVADTAWCGDRNTLISSGGTDTSVLVWDTQRREIIRTLDRASGSRSISCTQDGHFVVSGSSNKENFASLRVWDLTKTEAATDIAGPFPPIEGRTDNFVRRLIFSSDNSRLYAHYSNRKNEHRLITYQVNSWEVLTDIPLPGVLDAEPVLNKSNQLYVFGLRSRDVVIINALTGAERIRFRTEELVPNVLAFGRNDTTILVGGRRLYKGTHQGIGEQVIEEYSLDDGKLVRAIVTGHIDGLSGLAFLRDSSRLVTSSGDKTIELRNSDTGSLIATRGDGKSLIYSLEVRPDGKLIATAGGGVINLWSLH